MKEQKNNNKIGLIILLLLLLVVPFTKAIPQINFTYEGDENVTFMNASTIIYQASTFNISYFNSGDTSITNLSCYSIPNFNCSNSQNIIELGQSDYFFFDVTTNQIFSPTLYIVSVNYLFLTPFEVEKTNYTIIMNDYGINQSPYNPNNLTVLLNDTITWNNNDNVSHSISVLVGSNKFDVILAPGQSYSFTPTIIEEWEVYDKITGKNGYLIVLNNTAYYSTHNAEYDKTFSVNLKSEHAPTTIINELYTKEFVINYYDTISGVFRIMNTMDEPAYNVRFGISTPFVSTSEFVPQNKSPVFNLMPNESIIVLFNTRPSISNSDETGKGYNASIKISADNINAVTENFFVSIRFSDIINETGCNIDWQGRITYCRENPTSIYCLTEPLEKNVTIIEYLPLLYYTNFTEEQVRNAFVDRPTCEQILTRLSNRFDDVSANLQNNTVSVEGVGVIISLANQREYERLQNETASLRKEVGFVKSVYPVLFGVFLFVGLLIFFVVRALRNRGSE